MEDTNNTALAVVEPAAPLALFGTTDPGLVIERASQVATVLAKIVNERKLYAIVDGRKFPTVEGWTMLGGMLGVFAHTEWTQAILDEGGKIRGYKARVVARTLSGVEVGAAEAMCIRGESKQWGEYAKDYALLSMAQTRATSKAMGNPLRWVFKLAGYEGASSEEMDGVKDSSGEIPTDQASPETVAALKEAETLAEATATAPANPAAASQSPSAQVNSQAQATALTPASGPRAKRSQNVVAAPAALPHTEVTPFVPPEPSQPLTEASVAQVVDPGQGAFLATLREQAREAAAVLRQQSVLHKNRKAMRENQATWPVPSDQPNSESDEALRLLVSQPPKDLKKLNAKKLEELDQVSLEHVLEWLEGKTEKLKAAK